MTRISVVRDATHGYNAMAFRSKEKAEAYRRFLGTQSMPAMIDEVELDEEPSEPEVGAPHSVIITLHAQIRAKIGEVAADGESPQASAHQAQWWAESKLGEAFGGALQMFAFDKIEVLDEQGRRVQG